MTGNDTSFIVILAIREQFRDRYLQHRDPIAEDRMLWRGQTFRHMVHLLPGQTILELGCGQEIFTHQLARCILYLPGGNAGAPLLMLQ